MREVNPDREAYAKRLQAAYNYLLSRGEVHSKADLARATKKKPADISSAFSGHPKVMTKGLLTRVADAFPDLLNREYLLEGTGEVGRPDASALKPLLPGSVAAGFSSHVSEGVVSFPFIRAEDILGDFDLFIRVTGDSMLPAFQQGDIVCCRRIADREQLSPSCFYVIDAHEGAVLKQIPASSYSSVTCRSLNPDFPDFVIPAADINAIYKVVASIRPLNGQL